MTPAYLILALAAIIAMGVRVSVHRYLGLCAIAAGGVGVNYFLMDPIYSLRVSQAGDIAALSLYGAFGMFVALHRAQPARRSRAIPLDAYHFGLLVHLCAEINRISVTPVDDRKVLSVALRRLRQKMDSEGPGEILEDMRLQLEYERWVAPKLKENDT